MYDGRMSEAIAFDTHRFVKRLTDSGFTEKQAETLADEHVSLLNANLATKSDVATIDERIAQVDERIARLEERVAQIDERVAQIDERVAQIDERVARLEERVAQIDERVARLEDRVARVDERVAQVGERIEASKSDLLKWILGALIAQGGLIVALVKLL